MRDAVTSRWAAHIQTKTLSGLEVNATYYFLWTFEGGDALRARRFVSMTVARPLPTPIYNFNWGFFDTTTALGTFTPQGSTTGAVTLGSPGTIRVDIPMSRMGNPQPGSVLGDILLDARVLIGTAATGGLVGTADLTDGDPCFELTIP